MSSVALVLWIPISAAALLAFFPGYRLTSRLNVLASLLTLAAALSLFGVDRGTPIRVGFAGKEQR